MHIRTGGLLLALLVLAIARPQAQEGCPVVVRQALQSLGDNCVGMGRNVVCYGNNEVRAAFTQAVAEDFFTRPSDMAALDTVTSVMTASLQPAENVWGVAVLNVQANVPESIPGQAVTFLLLGDGEIENAADPALVPAPRPSIPVVTRVNGNIRSGPGTNFNRLDVARAGSTLAADAVTPDGQWVRIVYASTPGWMFRDNLAPDAAIDALGMPDDSARGLMQAFYLRTGIGQPTCTEAPQNALLVQGPRNFAVTLTVNGANVTFGSSVLFRTLGDNREMLDVVVLDGRAEVTPDIEGAETVVIPAGFRSVFCLGEADDLGTDGEANDQLVTCNGLPPQRVPASELRGWCDLQDMPLDLLHYAIDLPCPGDPVTVPPTPAVPPGQPPAAPSDDDDDDTSQAGACSVVSVVGPYGNAKPAGQVFAWNAVPGATSYELRLYDTSFSQLASFNTGGSTGITIDPIQHTQGTFYFEVFAFSGPSVLCTSGRIGGISFAAPSLDGRVSCIGLQYDIAWWNALPSDTITYEVPGILQETPIGSGSSGSAVVTGVCAGDVILRSSSGSSKFFPNVVCGVC